MCDMTANLRVKCKRGQGHFVRIRTSFPSVLDIVFDIMITLGEFLNNCRRNNQPFCKIYKRNHFRGHRWCLPFQDVGYKHQIATDNLQNSHRQV